MNEERHQETLPLTGIGREYTDFIQQSETAMDLFREAQHAFDHRKAQQAADLLKNTILRMASVPGFLKRRSFADWVSGQPDEVEVLCFESLTRLRQTGELVTICLFRDGLFWVPMHSNDYLFNKRVSLTDAEILLEIGNLGSVLYFSSQEFSSRTA